MEIWHSLHNTASHKPQVIVTQISLTHRPKDGRVITILVKLSNFQVLSYHLSFKAFPPTSLLSHSNLSLASWSPGLSFLATITVLLPYPPLLWGFKKSVDDTGNTQRHSSEHSSSGGFTCIPLQPYTNPPTTPRTLSLLRNTPPLTSRLPNLWL